MKDTKKSSKILSVLLTMLMLVSMPGVTSFAETLVNTEESQNNTVLYADGTLVINETEKDRGSNAEKHGEVTNIYGEVKNGFESESDILWIKEAEHIKRFEMGSELKLKSTKYLLAGLKNLESTDLKLLDTSETSDMSYMFADTNILLSAEKTEIKVNENCNTDNMFLNSDAGNVISVIKQEVHKEVKAEEQIEETGTTDIKETEISDIAAGREKKGTGISFYAANIVQKLKWRTLNGPYQVRHNWCDGNGNVYYGEPIDGTISQIKTQRDGLVVCMEGGYGIRADGEHMSEESITDWNDNSRGWNNITYTVHDIGIDNSVENKIYRIAPKYSTGNSEKDWAFMQMAMWQCMPRSYDHAEGHANNGTFFTYFKNSSVNSEFNTWKAKLLKELNVWDTKPSFADSAMDIKAGETKTFTDSRGSMQYYETFTITKSGVTVSHRYGSNDITVTAASDASSSSVSMNTTELANAGGVKYKDNGVAGSYLYTSGRSQNIKFMRGKVSPVNLSLSFNVTLLGKVTLKKKVASNEHLVKNCPQRYNLKGAEYSVYKTEADALNNRAAVGKLTTTEQKTGADGMLYAESNSLALPPGTYFVKETKAPEGYYKDNKMYSVSVTNGNDSVVNVSDNPQFDPLRLKLSKHIPAGKDWTKKYLENAEYTVKYYPDYYSTEKELSNAKLMGVRPLRTWVFRTDVNGIIKIGDEWYVGGNPLFRDSDGQVVGLYGTYVFEETKAPPGFIKNDGVTIRQIHQGIEPDYIDDTNHGDAKNVAAEDLENPTSKSLTVGKKISKDNVYKPYGYPTAIFEIEGTDVYGKTIIYHEAVTLDESTFDGSNYYAEFTLNNLPAGEYRVSEIKTSRYKFKNATVMKGEGTLTGETVLMNLINNHTGKVVFENEISRWNDYSHSHCIVNQF